MLARDHWLRHIARLDPERDFEEIYRIVVAHEFPWDMNQALSFALFRTYAVPSIGRLLDETGEFDRTPRGGTTTPRCCSTSRPGTACTASAAAARSAGSTRCTAPTTSPTTTSATCWRRSW